MIKDNNNNNNDNNNKTDYTALQRLIVKLEFQQSGSALEYLLWNGQTVIVLTEVAIAANTEYLHYSLSVNKANSMFREDYN